jgi:hypothetical protein
VNELLGETLDDAEAQHLAELLGRIPGVDPDVGSCGPE